LGDRPRYARTFTAHTFSQRMSSAHHFLNETDSMDERNSHNHLADIDGLKPLPKRPSPWLTLTAATTLRSPLLSKGKLGNSNSAAVCRVPVLAEIIPGVCHIDRHLALETAAHGSHRD
jgi:hypothetical protein